MGNNEEIVVYVDPLLKNLIPKFLEHQKIQLKRAQSALKSSNYADLKLLGHQMKGACGGYGFPMLGEFGANIEKSAEEKDVEALSLSIIQLERCLENIKIEYRMITKE